MENLFAKRLVLLAGLGCVVSYHQVANASNSFDGEWSLGVDMGIMAAKLGSLVNELPREGYANVRRPRELDASWGKEISLSSYDSTFATVGVSGRSYLGPFVLGASMSALIPRDTTSSGLVSDKASLTSSLLTVDLGIRVVPVDVLQCFFLGSFGGGQNQIFLTPEANPVGATASEASDSQEKKKLMGSYLSYGGSFRVELLTNAKGGMMIGADVGYVKTFSTRPYKLDGKEVSSFTNDGLDAIFVRISLGGARS